jgi:hypothetical protein
VPDDDEVQQLNAKDVGGAAQAVENRDIVR